MNSNSRKIDAVAADWILRRESGLTEPEAREFAAWKSADRRHEDSIARHESTWSLLDRQRESGRAGALVVELARRNHRRRRRRVIAATFCVPLLIAAGIWSSRQADRPSPGGNVVILRPDRRVLPDGSAVELKPGAEIAVDYSGPFRRVVLKKGAALFQVAKNKERPFVVSAGGDEVRAVGTAFVVNIETGTLDVLVTEGRVQVRSQTPANPLPQADRPVGIAEAPAFVDAGNRLTVSAATDSDDAPLPRQATPVSHQEIAEKLSWRTPRLEFLEMPLGEAVAMMNQRSLVQMLVDDPALAAIRVNGLFRANNSEAFVRILETNFGVVATRSDKIITLRRAAR